VADDSEHQLSVSGVYHTVNRPVSQLGAINQFESASTSVTRNDGVAAQTDAGGMYFRQA
jgi:hypothetical protein